MISHGPEIDIVQYDEISVLWCCVDSISVEKLVTRKVS